MVNRQNTMGGRAAEALKEPTLSDRAYEAILGMIMEGEIPVGGKLPTEHKLCERLKLSRPVLRQALKQLREDDVIVSRQGSGSYVRRRPEMAVLDFAPVGSIADIQRTFEFRSAVEGEAAFLAATRRSESDLNKMKSILDELDRVIAAGDLGVDADEDFHAAICMASDNQYFSAARASMKANIITGLNLTRNLSLTKPQERMQLVQAEHYEIYNAIKLQEPDAARLAMRTHIDNARKRVFDGTS
ncbi:FadR/GntR family transcriptional regulator [Cognatishimia sp.]|uniref:FadR/GntR family transcriptional regulator n=1 Tax=Cognatishimia sp. TaxID=2211648 RepID=UPI003BAAE4FC